jgi:hypothetical protein
MARAGRWISLIPIAAVIPRLGLMVIAADRQPISQDTRQALLWVSSTALAVLVGSAEVYVGIAVVARKHKGLALVWAAITVLLNALILPLAISGLEAEPAWQILGSRAADRLGLRAWPAVDLVHWRVSVGRRGAGRLGLGGAVRGPPAGPARRRRSAAQRAGSGAERATSGQPARCQRRSERSRLAGRPRCLSSLRVLASALARIDPPLLGRSDPGGGGRVRARDTLTRSQKHRLARAKLRRNRDVNIVC